MNDPLGSTHARGGRRRKDVSIAASVAFAAAMLSACGGDAPPVPAGSDLQAAIQHAEQAAAGSAPASDALQPGQRLQGTITLDVGEGPRSYRVIATKLADDLGKRAAARLGSAEGKAALDKANTRTGGKVQVAASDVQELADAFAGKTMYSAELRTIDIIKRQQMTIEGEAADGSRVVLDISLPIGGDEVVDASLAYRPDARRRTDEFNLRLRDGGMRVDFERLQRDDARSWSVAGSFEATNMKPGVLAKGLVGRSIERATGRFDVTELHVRAP